MSTVLSPAHPSASVAAPLPKEWPEYSPRMPHSISLSCSVVTINCFENGPEASENNAACDKAGVRK